MNKLATNEESLVPEKTKQMILEKTPRQFVKSRRGRGNTTLDYVETGYVISKLNEVFNYLWDFEVLEEKIGNKQVYVRGKLTGHISPSLAITKTQYGGSDIKGFDIADDLKAAASDSLKKCASMFGIAQDIFWPTGSEYQDGENTASTPREMRQEIDPDPNMEETITIPATEKQKTLLAQFYEDGKIERMTEDEFADWLEDIDKAQASDVISKVLGGK